MDVGGGIFRTLSFRIGDDPELAAKQFLFQQGMATTSANAKPIVQAIVAKVMTLSFYEPPSVPLFRRFLKLHMVPEYHPEDAVVEEAAPADVEAPETDITETAEVEAAVSETFTAEVEAEAES